MASVVGPGAGQPGGTGGGHGGPPGGPVPAGGRRPRAPYRLRLLAAGFLLLPLLEIIVLVLVGRAIGGWPTFGLVLLGMVCGALVVRSSGRRAWRSLNSSVRAGQMPSADLADPVLVLVGGVLLMVPGFITDVLALLFLLPPTRAAARGLLRLFVARRLLVFWGGRRGPRGPGGPDVVEGEVL